MHTSAYIKKLNVLAGICLALLFLPACMKDRPDTLPEKLDWNPQFALPLGDDVFGMNSHSGFDTLLLDLDTLSGLPVWTTHQEVVMEGIFDFDLSGLSNDLDKLNRILIRVNITNQFPHTMFSQAYFRDQDGMHMDSLFLDGPVETDAGSVKAKHDALIEGDRLPAAVNARSILFRSSFRVASLDTMLIPAYPGFQLQVDAGLMLDLSFEY